MSFKSLVLKKFVVETLKTKRKSQYLSQEFLMSWTKWNQSTLRNEGSSYPEQQN